MNTVGTAHGTVYLASGWAIRHADVSSGYLSAIEAPDKTFRERERERDSESASTCGSQVPNWRACCATPGVPLRKSRMPYKPPPRIGGANALGRAGLFTRFSHSALPTAQSVTEWAEAQAHIASPAVLRTHPA